VITGIDHVQVAAPPGCEEAARAFYGELLGLDELPKPEELAGRGGVWFACGTQQLHVGVQPDFAPAAKAHPALQVSDTAALSELTARLEAAGHRATPDAPATGGSRVHVTDPFGNRLELCVRAAATA
jgi:catechol 2,3-dioxygenase-like lactoylglutathione lyase family enzyme